MNSEGDMDTISLQRSARISNRIRNEIEKEIDCSSTPRKPKRKGTTSTSVQCERSNKMGRLIGFTSPITTLPDDLVIDILSRLPLTVEYTLNFTSSALQAGLMMEKWLIPLAFSCLREAGA